MRRQGIRRLLVLSGEPLVSRTGGGWRRRCLSDWPWVGQNPPPGLTALASSAVRQLLGQERLHAVFDAGQSLDVEALAALCGALRAGGWLLLLTPPAAMASAAGRRQPALERLPTTDHHPAFHSPSAAARPTTE
ncbi:hypothetical protein M8494_02850 [Serratia ureilytica]